MWQVPALAAIHVLLPIFFIFMVYRLHFKKRKNNALNGNASSCGATAVDSGPSHLYISSPLPTFKVLFLFRIFCIAFFSTVFVSGLYLSSGNSLVYYTVWTFLMQGAYFVWAAMHQRRSIPIAHMPTLQQNRWLDILLDVSISTSVLVTIVYWALLYPRKKDFTWLETLTHGVNCFFLWVEFVLKRHIVQGSSWPILMLCPTIFGGFTWLRIHTSSNARWPYRFLDISNQYSVAWYIGMLIAHLFVFGIVYSASRLQQWFWNRRTADVEASQMSLVVESPVPLGTSKAEAVPCKTAIIATATPVNNYSSYDLA
jgi:hypothetical protein